MWWCRWSAESAPAVSTLVVSGKTPERVASTAAVLADWMDGAGAAVGLAEVAHTLNHHRTRHARFATVCAADRDAGGGGVARRWPPGWPGLGVVLPHEGPCGSGTVFVYSGQGSQWAGMGRQLLADEPAFAAAVAELEPVFVDQTGFSLHEVLAEGQPVTGIERIQPVLVGVQLALTALWRSYGVSPDAVIGHSMGEVTRRGGGRGADPGRGLAGDRHPVAVDGPAGRAGRDGAAGAGRRGHRGADRRLSRGVGGGVCLAAPDGDRRAARRRSMR